MAEMIQYQLSTDANRSTQGIVLAPSKYVNAYVLAAGVAQDVTVPSGARIAIFNSTGNYYVNWLTTAAEPSSNITDGSGPELNPVARDVSAVASLSMVAPAACIVTIAYFA